MNYSNKEERIALMENPLCRHNINLALNGMIPNLSNNLNAQRLLDLLTNVRHDILKLQEGVPLASEGMPSMEKLTKLNVDPNPPQ